MNKQNTLRGMPGFFATAQKPAAKPCRRRFWRQRAHLNTTTDRPEEIFSLSSPKVGEGRGAEANLIECPPRPSPHSFLAGRGRKLLVVVSRCARRHSMLLA